MKKFKLLILLSVAAGLLALINSRNESSHREQLRSAFFVDLQLTRNSLLKLDRICSNGASVEELKHAFLNSRLSFKRTESFLAYYDDSYYNALNGPNITKVDKASTQYSDIEPHGYQVIEDILSRDLTPDDRSQIITECREMDRIIVRIQKDHDRFTFYDREIMESHQQEVIRINAHGLTGFDSPVLHYSLEETKVVLENMGDQLEKMSSITKTTAQLHHLEATIKCTRKAAQKLEKAEFNSFDRLTYIKKELDPLFKRLMELQQILGIETYAQSFGTPGALNEKARSLYGSDLVNRFFFLLTKPEMDRLA